MCCWSELGEGSVICSCDGGRNTKRASFQHYAAKWERSTATLSRGFRRPERTAATVQNQNIGDLQSISNTNNCTLFVYHCEVSMILLWAQVNFDKLICQLLSPVMPPSLLWRLWSLSVCLFLSLSLEAFRACGLRGNGLKVAHEFSFSLMETLWFLYIIIVAIPGQDGLQKYSVEI